MGFPIFKRVKILPCFSLNLSKSGPSISVGPRGTKTAGGPRGVRKTFVIPGTGIYYMKMGSAKSAEGARSSTFRFVLAAAAIFAVLVLLAATAGR